MASAIAIVMEMGRNTRKTPNKCIKAHIYNEPVLMADNLWKRVHFFSMFLTNAKFVI